MTESNDAPWFDALSDADKASYIASAAELVYDLRKAATFMNSVKHMREFPVRSYQPEVDLSYFVQNTDPDPQALFEGIKANILAAGGTCTDKLASDGMSVHHIAQMRFGSGRVAYRVVWIERTPTDG